ncbi:hypothetical protein D3C84_776200 [compost metagenome]
MPKLSEDHTPFGVNGVGDFAPAFNLLGAVNAGSPGITLSTRLDLGAFGHHESRASTLAVIRGHEIVRNVARLGATRTGKWWQNDSILEGVGPQLCGFEERGLCHFIYLHI